MKISTTDFGKIKIIGATTTEEYKEYIEKDKALSRRFQTVTVKEPNIETVAKDTLIQDVFNVIYDARTPVAVVEGKRLLGVIIRGVVIEALAKTEEVES